MKLRDFPFTDLYISENGVCRMRGMKSGGPLAAPPGFIKPDIKRFAETLAVEMKGRNEFTVPFDGINYRVSLINDVSGSWFAVRKAAKTVPSLEELQIPHLMRERLMKAGASHGLILVSGPTGSGKTTTASALVQAYLQEFGDVAVTIEEPPELALSGPHGKNGWCYQMAVKDGDFATPLTHTMRYQPRIIMIGEIRTTLATKIMLRASVNGHLVISTMHAGSVVEAISGVMTYLDGPENEYMTRVLGEGLVAVLNQRLVGSPKTLNVSCLFNDDFAIATKIRSGRFEQLATEIEKQSRELAGSRSGYE